MSTPAALDAQLRDIYAQLECVPPPVSPRRLRHPLARDSARPPPRREGFFFTPSRTEPQPTTDPTPRAHSTPLPSPRVGFKQTDKLEADQATATAHVKALTGKMAESKRLIKEYERVSKEDPACDLDALAARKKEMVQGLNAFVNRKKAAQADIAARAAAEEAATAAAAAAAEAPVPRAKTAPPATSSTTSAFTNPFASSSSAASKDAKGKGVASELGQVELQVMDTESVLAYGRGKMQETDDAIERSKRTVATTIQIGSQTAEALRGQTQQMEKIVDNLDEIHFSLKKSMRVIKDLTRGLATDKCILTLLFIVVAGIVSIIAVKVAGLDKDDKVASVRRLARRMLWEEAEPAETSWGMDTRTGVWLPRGDPYAVGRGE